MTKYPRDEFDQVPETYDRHGVHRAHVDVRKSSGLGLIILASVLALAVGAVSFFVVPLLGAGGTGLPATQTATAAESPAAATKTAEPTEPAASKQAAKPTEAATKEAKEATAEPTDEPTEEPSEDPSAEAAGEAVNRADPLLIFNAAGVTGLGGTVSGRLSADGWSVALVDNWQGGAMPNSVIYYNPGQAANAEAVGQLLGITDLRETAQGAVSLYVTVVLGPGFQ
ncbi:LytR C-terminal domain-containing protein [Arthrobacter sp. USHLN218]|uniref:LytR C-terminal domain-containing protein n=1 Tax=Arthrobacter sp. USHLN218 TaxID=3081232 RepID=UPI003015E226